jgi:hypothetical protein
MELVVTIKGYALINKPTRKVNRAVELWSGVVLPGVQTPKATLDKIRCQRCATAYLWALYFFVAFYVIVCDVLFDAVEAACDVPAVEADFFLTGEIGRSLVL